MTLQNASEMVPGIRRQKVGDRMYYYHRRTGRRLNDDPSAHAAEVSALDATAPARPVASAVLTLGGLIAEYKRSPEWGALAPDTQKSYERAFDAAHAGRDEPVTAFDARVILAARDAIYALPPAPRKRASRTMRTSSGGRWMANNFVAVMSVLFAWAVPRGYVDINPGAGVPKIRGARGQGVANPSWSPEEVTAMLALAEGGMRKGIALAFYTGMRLKDVVETKRTEWKGDRIERQSSKPGVYVTHYVVKSLSAILSVADVVRQRKRERLAGLPVLVPVYLIVNERGEQFTRSGFNSNFQKLKDELARAGKLSKGRTFHGLRKSLGKDAADLGFSENDIAGVLGQTSPASARPYTIEAKQRKAAERVMRALERKGKR
ncbi:tyrosine-type recombinase/integrase [Reyranella sp.]|uniref:tyrosine-type recombinase/integrase n=1 Tax=Reyranella sp. TaxID=1929291 RepID=UPI003784AAD1